MNPVWLPLFVVIPMAAAFLIPLIARKVKWFTHQISGLAMIAVFLLSIRCLHSEVLVSRIGGWPIPFGINLILDGFSAFMLMIVSTIGLIVIFFAFEYMSRYTSELRFFSLFMFMITGLNGIILSGDLFNMYIFIEMASISAYALVGFGCGQSELEASFKYLIQGIIASSLILLGIIIIYGMLGTLNIAQLAVLIYQQGLNPPLLFALACFHAGLGMKMGLVPFHAWLPDAHPAAPAPISAMLSGVLIKTAGAYVLIRLVFNMFGINQVISNIWLIFGAISMVAGVFLALGQWDYKRLLAYHSVSQVGYIILGIGLGTPLGILGGLFHLANHAVFKSLLFLNAGSVEYATGTRQLKKIGGLAEKMPITGFTSLVASMSIAGIPPFNGFWSKLIIVIACVQAGQYWLAVIAVLVSLMTLASFLKVQKYGFFSELKENLAAVKEVPFLMSAAMIVLALLCVVLGLLLYPQVREIFLQPAANVLINGTDYATNVLGSLT